MTSTFRKLALGVAAAATVGGSMILTADPAEAQRRHYRGVRGGAVAAGVIGGLALGAAAAAAASNRPYYGRGYAPAYGYAPVYGGGDCWMEQRVRYDRWGRQVVRNVEICN